MRWEWIPPVLNPCNGVPFAWTNHWQRPDDYCPDCSKKRNAEAEARRLKRESEEIIRLQKKLEDSITDELGGSKTIGWTFENYRAETKEEKMALESAQRASECQANLYLFGKTTGTGKSHLAGAAYRARRSQRKTAQWWKPPTLLRYLRVLEAEEQEARMRGCISDGVFVLDDIGIGNTTDFALQALYEIVDGRWMNESKGLIITANISLDDLAKKLQDDRLPSRLAGMCEVIEMKGKDRRVSR